MYVCVIVYVCISVRACVGVCACVCLCSRVRVRVHVPLCSDLLFSYMTLEVFFGLLFVMREQEDASCSSYDTYYLLPLPPPPPPPPPSNTRSHVPPLPSYLFVTPSALPWYPYPHPPNTTAPRTPFLCPQHTPYHLTYIVMPLRTSLP